MAPTLREVVHALDERYPRTSAEVWDHVGLQVSRDDAEISQLFFTVDVTEGTVAEAVKRGAQLIVSHHPLFFGDIDSLDAGNVKARLAHTLIKNNCALYVAHTNADVANPGVNDALAKALGLVDALPLVPASEKGFGQLTYYVPKADHDAVLEAVFAAGAGAYRNYDRAAFVSSGRGQFRPLEGANPAVGSIGSDEFVDEYRVEVIVDMSTSSRVIAALLQAHPYEEVAYNLIQTQPRDAATGHGRVGHLPSPMTLADFAAVVHKSLPATAHGVRFSGNPERMVSKIALCGGSGSDFLSAAHACSADVFLSADFKHHQVQDFVAQSGIAVIDVAHWASEWPWLHQAAELLKADLQARKPGAGTSVEVHVSSTPTDPWSGRL